MYLTTSYVLLNGRVSYTTTFCSHSKLDSKNRKLFLKDDLKIEYNSSNRMLKKIVSENDIWIEKHYDVKYFGIIFHRNVENKNYRKLRFECKNSFNCEMKVCDIIIENDTIEKATIFPDTQIAIKIGKTVNYIIYEYNYGKKISIGLLSVIVE